VKALMCDTSGKDTVQQMAMARTLFDEKTCPGKKQPLCDAVRREAPRDQRVYLALVQYDKQIETRIAATCAINMEATTASLCKTFNSGNADLLTPYCPAQAKAYREAERRKLCEGRSYTAQESLARCLRGEEPADNAEGDETPDGADGRATPRTKARAGATGNASTSGSTSKGAEGQGNTSSTPQLPALPNPAEALIDGAKKLKGLFGL
ncbi:MAG: hypothetical protein ACR2I0_05255, partial [Rhodoferax sp.]